jgi:hypothetical protein
VILHAAQIVLNGLTKFNLFAKIVHRVIGAEMNPGTITPFIANKTNDVQ